MSSASVQSDYCEYFIPDTVPEVTKTKGMLQSGSARDKCQGTVGLTMLILQEKAEAKNADHSRACLALIEAQTSRAYRTTEGKKQEMWS